MTHQSTVPSELHSQAISESWKLSAFTLSRFNKLLLIKMISALVVSGCAFFGYITGGSLLVTGLLMPFASDHTGLWVQGGRLVSSTLLAAPAHQVMSWQVAVAVAIVGGSAFLVLTTMLIRLALRYSKSWQKRLYPLGVV